VSRIDLRQRLVWLRAAAVLVAGGLALAIWTWSMPTTFTPDDFAASLAPHRGAWYALPAVMLAFIALGLAMVPVLLLITATGIAFGPLLGPVYAMAGCLASASTGFAIGRWVGWRRLEHVGGERLERLTRTLRRHGTLAVYFIRKIPAPFTLVNIVVGASSVRYRDFLIGTTLGMAAAVVALAGFGHQFMEVWRDPTPAGLAKAALFIAVPLGLAWIVNRALSRGVADA
jgi:phospholipase D1/2